MLRQVSSIEMLLCTRSSCRLVQVVRRLGEGEGEGARRDSPLQLLVTVLVLVLMSHVSCAVARNDQRALGLRGPGPRDAARVAEGALGEPRAHASRRRRRRSALAEDLTLHLRGERAALVRRPRRPGRQSRRRGQPRCRRFACLSLREGSRLLRWTPQRHRHHVCQ